MSIDEQIKFWEREYESIKPRYDARRALEREYRQRQQERVRSDPEKLELQRQRNRRYYEKFDKHEYYLRKRDSQRKYREELQKHPILWEWALERKRRQNQESHQMRKRLRAGEITPEEHEQWKISRRVNVKKTIRLGRGGKKLSKEELEELYKQAELERTTNNNALPRRESGRRGCQPSGPVLTREHLDGLLAAERSRREEESIFDMVDFGDCEDDGMVDKEYGEEEKMY